MKKIFVIAAFFLAATMTQAQSSELGNWLIYLGNKKLNNKWNLHHEIQHRNYNAISDLEQLLLRTGIGYNIDESGTNVLIGYGYIHSQNYVGDEKRGVNESRIFQQFVTKQNLGRVKLLHRYRFEQRWIEGQDFRMRFRYFLAMNIPLNKKELVEKALYLIAYDEVFLNHNNQIFDRNRLFTGVGYVLNSHLKLSLGYMNQYFSVGKRDQINILAFLNF